MPTDIKRPVYRFRVTTPTRTLRWATRDLDDDVVPYHGVVIDVSAPEQRLADSVYRTLDTPRLRLRITDRLGRYTPEYRYLFEGARIEAERYDTVTQQVYARFAGTIVQPSIPAPSQIELEAENLKRDVLSQEIPTIRVTSDRFPTARPEALGKPAGIIIGNGLNIELPIVHDDIPGNTCDGLLGLAVGGGALSVTQVRRAGVGDRPFGAVSGSEYSVTTRVDALGVTWWVVRFNVRQLAHNSTELVPLWADAQGPAADRNPATAVQALLSNSVWSVGEPVNAASFAAAAAIFDQLNYKVDGVLYRPAQLQDVLARLLLRGMMPDVNAAGEWFVTVDTAPSSVALQLGVGPGDGPRNLVDIRNRQPVRDRVRDLIVEYDDNPFDDTTLFRATRQVSQANGFGTRSGTDLTIRPLVRDPATADMEADYLAKTIRFGGETAEIEMLQEAASLGVGSLLQLYDRRRGGTAYNGDQVRLREFGDPLTRLRGLVQGYDSRIFTYEAQALPSSPAAGAAVDYTRTPPDAATSLSIDSSGTRVSVVDGVTSGYVVLKFNTSTTNYSHAVVKYRRWTVGGTEQFTAVGPTYASGTNVRVEVPGLVCGIPYDYIVQVVNKFGLVSIGDPSLTNQTAPGTAVLPTAASSLTISSSGVDVATDGSTSAFVVLSFTTPTSNYAHAIVGYRQNTTSVYTRVGPITGSGVGVTVKIQGLVCGVPYDYTVQTVNGFGLVSTGDPTLSNQLAPDDGVAPGAPGTPTIVSQEGLAVTLKWTASSSPKTRGYNWDLRTASGGGGSVIASGFVEGATVTIHADTFATRHFRVQAVAFTAALTSSFTNSVSVTFAKLTGGGIDNTGNGAGTENIVANAVTSVSTVSNISDPADTRSGTETEAQISGMSFSKTLGLAASPVIVNLSSVSMKLTNTNTTTARVCKVILSMKRGSSYLAAGRLTVELPGAAQPKYVEIPMTLTTVDSPGSVGPHTYTANWQVDDGNGGTTDASAATAPIYMQATELKK